MVNSGARRCGLVILSTESAERSTTHLCQIFEVTWLLCHPDLSGLRIDGSVLASPSNLGSLYPDGDVYRLRLGRLLALGRVDCSGQSAVPVPISAQLQPSRLIVLVMEGWPGFAWADCWHQSC